MNHEKQTKMILWWIWWLWGEFMTLYTILMFTISWLNWSSSWNRGVSGVGAAASFGNRSSTVRTYLAAVGSGYPYFSVESATAAFAVDSNRMEVLCLDLATGDWADSHRPCIGLQVLHHCCLADSGMVVVPREKSEYSRKEFISLIDWVEKNDWKWKKMMKIEKVLRKK